MFLVASFVIRRYDFFHIMTMTVDTFFAWFCFIIQKTKYYCAMEGMWRSMMRFIDNRRLKYWAFVFYCLDSQPFFIFFALFHWSGRIGQQHQQVKSLVQFVYNGLCALILKMWSFSCLVNDFCIVSSVMRNWSGYWRKEYWNAQRYTQTHNSIVCNINILILTQPTNASKSQLIDIDIDTWTDKRSHCQFRLLFPTKCSVITENIDIQVANKMIELQNKVNNFITFVFKL